MKKLLFVSALTLGASFVALSGPSVAAAAPRLPLPVADFDEHDPDLAPTEVPGVVVLDFKDSLSDSDIASFGKEYGLDIVDNSPDLKGDGNIELTQVAVADEPGLLRRLQGDARLEAAEPLYVARAFFVPDDPKYSEQWHLTRVGSESAWDYACGMGVTVAVIDTGIACYDKSPFMKGTDLSGTGCVDGYNFVAKNTVAADDHGHGTHVAGTIAQTTNNGQGVAGLAHCAKLMPVKVLSKGGYGTMADVAEGIRFAADHGAQVMNLSLGSNQKSKVVENAVNYALSKNVVVVAAAGNSGRSVGYPAGYPGVVAVSATDRNDKLAWFSSRGPEVVIGAPGVAVTQQTVCNGGANKCEVFGVFNGTSMASPHVAGAAALLVGQGVTDRESIADALTKSATPKENKEHFGAGILEAGKSTRTTFFGHLVFRLLALFGFGVAVAAMIKKKGGKFRLGKAGGLGALTFATGLLPILAPLGFLPRAGGFRIFAEMAARPVSEWDILLNAGLHKYFLLANAGPALLFTALFFGSKRLRPFAGGVALGSAAILAQMALSGDSAFFLGPFAARLFLAANIAVCLFLARNSLDAKGERA